MKNNIVIRTLWNGWMKFAHVFGWINNRIILSVLYFVIFGFYAIPQKVRALFIKDVETAGWKKKKVHAEVLSRLERQF